MINICQTVSDSCRTCYFTLIQQYYSVNDKHCQTVSDSCRTCYFTLIQQYYSVNDKHCQTVSDSCRTCYFTLIQQYYSVNDKHMSDSYINLLQICHTSYFKNIIYQSKIFLGSTLFTPLVTVRHFT